MKAGLVCVCMRWCVFLASHRRAQPLLPMQTQCGPSASATCPGETLPRESCHIHQGEGRSVDMYLAAFGTYCIWIMHVIIFYGIRFHYKYYLTVENSICSLNGIKLLKHQAACQRINVDTRNVRTTERERCIYIFYLTVSIHQSKNKYSNLNNLMFCIQNPI